MVFRLVRGRLTEGFKKCVGPARFPVERRRYGGGGRLFLSYLFVWLRGVGSGVGTSALDDVSAGNDGVSRPKQKERCSGRAAWWANWGSSLGWWYPSCPRFEHLSGRFVVGCPTAVERSCQRTLSGKASKEICKLGFLSSCNPANFAPHRGEGGWRCNSYFSVLKPYGTTSLANVVAHKWIRHSMVIFSTFSSNLPKYGVPGSWTDLSALTCA